MGTRTQFLELDRPLQPDAYVGTLFCQGCGSSMSIGDEAPCDHCTTVLCDGCVEWQDGWHCEGAVDDYALAMDMLAWSLSFATSPHWGCCSDGHDKLKADRVTFESGVENCRPFPGLGLIGECSTCGSSLGFRIDELAEVA